MGGDVIYKQFGHFLHFSEFWLFRLLLSELEVDMSGQIYDSDGWAMTMELELELYFSVSLTL